ncbi:DUF3263 domain-containing protein [Microbacterium gilvum]|uniref:DUF3263 domain-containing protein n=1 Tax=Microbacterium gilvum TaxID=1336204 RepID=A0ABP9A6H8_9MICO
MDAATLIDFERTHPRHNGWKEETIRGQLGITPARYYVLLHRAAGSIDGIRHDPVTCRRIRARGRDASALVADRIPAVRE